MKQPGERLPVLVDTSKSGEGQTDFDCQVQNDALARSHSFLKPVETRRDETRAVSTGLWARPEAIAVRKEFASEANAAEALTDMDSVYFFFKKVGSGNALQ